MKNWTRESAYKTNFKRDIITIQYRKRTNDVQSNVWAQCESSTVLFKPTLGLYSFIRRATCVITDHWLQYVDIIYKTTQAF